MAKKLITPDSVTLVCEDRAEREFLKKYFKKHGVDVKDYAMVKDLDGELEPVEDNRVTFLALTGKEDRRWSIICLRRMFPLDKRVVQVDIDDPELHLDMLSLGAHETLTRGDDAWNVIKIVLNPE
jgi:hypothetical protein